MANFFSIKAATIILKKSARCENKLFREKMRKLIYTFRDSFYFFIYPVSRETRNTTYTRNLSREIA